MRDGHGGTATRERDWNASPTRSIAVLCDWAELALQRTNEGNNPASSRMTGIEVL